LGWRGGLLTPLRSSDCDRHCKNSDQDAVLTHDIALLQIDSETGILTLARSHACAEPRTSALAVDPSGQYLHVTSDKAGGVNTLKLNVATSTLVLAGETTAREKAPPVVKAQRLQVVCKGSLSNQGGLAGHTHPKPVLV